MTINKKSDNYGKKKEKDFHNNTINDVKNSDINRIPDILHPNQPEIPDFIVIIRVNTVNMHKVDFLIYTPEKKQYQEIKAFFDTETMRKLSKEAFCIEKSFLKNIFSNQDDISQLCIETINISKIRNLIEELSFYSAEKASYSNDQRIYDSFSIVEEKIRVELLGSTLDSFLVVEVDESKFSVTLNDVFDLENTHESKSAHKEQRILSFRNTYDIFMDDDTPMAKIVIKAILYLFFNCNKSTEDLKLEAERQRISKRPIDYIKPMKSKVKIDNEKLLYESLTKQLTRIYNNQYITNIPKTIPSSDAIISKSYFMNLFPALFDDDIDLVLTIKNGMDIVSGNFGYLGNKINIRNESVDVEMKSLNELIRQLPIELAKNEKIMNYVLEKIESIVVTDKIKGFSDFICPKCTDLFVRLEEKIEIYDLKSQRGDYSLDNVFKDFPGISDLRGKYKDLKDSEISKNFLINKNDLTNEQNHQPYYFYLFSKSYCQMLYNDRKRELAALKTHINIWEENKFYTRKQLNNLCSLRMTNKKIISKLLKMPSKEQRTHIDNLTIVSNFLHGDFQLFKDYEAIIDDDPIKIPYKTTLNSMIILTVFLPMGFRLIHMI